MTMPAGWLRDHRKSSIYLPEGMIEEIRQEAKRQDRSVSWLLQQAWKVAKPRIQQLPSQVPSLEEQRR